jgi:hypothetical protein
MVEEVEERSPSPERERGVRWNDPRFAIAWPAEPRVISDKDAQRRDFDPACIWQAEGRRGAGPVLFSADGSGKTAFRHLENPLPTQKTPCYQYLGRIWQCFRAAEISRQKMRLAAEW